MVEREGVRRRNRQRQSRHARSGRHVDRERRSRRRCRRRDPKRRRRFSCATWPRLRMPEANRTATSRSPARDGRVFPAVTISIAKRRGTNAIELAHRIEEKIGTIRGRSVPNDVELTITRNYGETARDKSNELLWHMLLAVLSVALLIWLALGRREAAVVMTAIPVTLALTLFVFYLYGYTLNRITLFALIFSIGILVDDAIVVVENIVRHARIARACDRDSLTLCGVLAVDEVGNPDDSGHADGRRRHSADGVCGRPDGAVHAADSGRRIGGDGVLAGRRVHCDAVGGCQAVEPRMRPMRMCRRTG